MKFTNIKKIPLFSKSFFFILTFFVLLISFFWYKKSKLIEYDSSGLGLFFISKEVILSSIKKYTEQRI